jgi:hypothetical protein
MLLQKWVSKPHASRPATWRNAQDTPAARQHENQQASQQDQTSGSNVRDLVPVVQVNNSQAPKQDFFEKLSGMPEEIWATVGQHFSNSDVATLSSVCRASQQSFWNSDAVWLALGARDNLYLGRSGVPKFTRDAYRRAVFRIDCADLAHVAQAPNAGVDANVFNEASHVLKGLMPADGQEIQLLSNLVTPALESLNFAAAGAAEAFLCRARRRSDLFSQQDLEMFRNAYDYALLQHNLMMDTIEEHLEELETQMWSVEQQVCEDHRSLIMDQ